jgi:hypothetical protein
VSAEQLESAARLLEPLLEDLVFVGGAVVPLLLTDPAAQTPRVTKDVDAIDTRAVSVALTYARASELRGLGFDEAQEMIGRCRPTAGTHGPSNTPPGASLRAGDQSA